MPPLTMSAKLTDLPSLAITCESWTWQSAGLAFSIAAPASISAMRPAAPARDIASKFIIVDHEPPVMIAPSTGSAYLGSLPTRLTRMWLHAAPSSSATSCAIVLAMCWPMSALPTFTVTSPSWPIEYQTLGE